MNFDVLQMHNLVTFFDWCFIRKCICVLPYLIRYLSKIYLKELSMFKDHCIFKRFGYLYHLFTHECSLYENIVQRTGQ